MVTILPGALYDLLRVVYAGNATSVVSLFEETDLLLSMP